MEKFRNGEGSGLVHLPGESLPVSEEKCKCGKTKFSYQRVCGECWLKDSSFKHEGELNNNDEETNLAVG